MAFVLSVEGAVLFLNYLLETPTEYSLELRLYTNDVTPTRTSTQASFTEASGSGYGGEALTQGGWTVTEGDADDNSYATYPEHDFIFTGDAGIMYGYYIVENNSPYKLLGGGRFQYSEPTFNGKTINVNARIEIGALLV